MTQMSPKLQARIEQQQAYRTQNNINPFVLTPRVDIGGAKLEQIDKDTVQLSTKGFDYSIDDGKISTGDKLKNFAKGLISPITTIFSSPKNFLIGAGMIAVGAAFTIATGGAMAPVFVALGITGGVVQLGTSIYKASCATTDDEVRKAWQGIGAGTSSVGMSALGSKAALKGAGVDTDGMGFLRATVECFKQVPRSVSKSVGAFTSGEAMANLKNVFARKKSVNPKSEPENNTTENNAKPKPEAKTEDKVEPKIKQKTEQPKTKEIQEPASEPIAELKQTDIVNEAGTYENPITTSENVATTTHTKTTEFLYHGADGKWYKCNVTYDSDMPDVPFQCRGKGSDLWDMYHQDLRDMQYNNGKLSAARQQDIINATKKDLDFHIEVLAERGMDMEKAKDTLMAKMIYSDPVGYHMKKINNALEDSNRLYQSFEPTTKEGYLYRGITINSDPKNNLFNSENFANMMNGLQKGQKFTLDYSPLCTGGIDICRQYARNAMLKIKVPAGVKLMHGGFEYRFPPKAQFIFNGIKELQGGMKFYDLEYVLPIE